MAKLIKNDSETMKLYLKTLYVTDFWDAETRPPTLEDLLEEDEDW